jgi:hypothetical protein
MTEQFHLKRHQRRQAQRAMGYRGSKARRKRFDPVKAQRFASIVEMERIKDVARVEEEQAEPEESLRA